MKRQISPTFHEARRRMTAHQKNIFGERSLFHPRANTGLLGHIKEVKGIRAVFSEAEKALQRYAKKGNDDDLMAAQAAINRGMEELDIFLSTSGVATERELVQANIIQISKAAKMLEGHHL